MTSVESGTIRNRLLTALPPHNLDELLPRLRRVAMPLKAVLLRSDEPVTTVYFPESGWVSLIMALDDGNVGEVGLVGLEGFVGLNALFGAGEGSMGAVVQAPGMTIAAEISDLQKAMEAMPALRTLLMRYALTFNAQVAITAVCNVRHSLKERMARWLLMSDDRAEGNEFPMTHEFLSLMLGVRRAGVSIAAATLRGAGLIRYRQGHVRVIDRPGLERVSCGCHRLARVEFDKLLKPTAD